MIINMSHDIEDIISVLDGRPEIAEEVKHSEPVLAKELAIRFHALLQDKQFVDAVSGHMPTDEASQARVPVIMKIINRIAKLD